ncbi:MAG: methylase involved in ubiquinone/menaquinone biosynthesis [Halorubrum sp. J07HR59]|nr:MAG: methylase involved in ubiquinone/menaquinone biosynthesis [Halorubrum sp. J07HR59]
MKKTPEQHARRFSAKAPDYDGSKSPVYEACASHTIRHAGPAAGEVILDIGAGTGAIGLALAADTDADSVVLRDISDGMLEEARAKVRDRGLDHVEIGTGSFRQPDYEGSCRCRRLEFRAPSPPRYRKASCNRHDDRLRSPANRSG